VTGHLSLCDLFGAKAEGRGVGVAGLGLEACPIDGASVEARRRAGLEAAATQAEQLERFSQQLRRGLAGAPGGIRLLAAVNEAVEKRSRSDDDRLRADGAAIAQLDAASNTAVSSQRSAVGGRAFARLLSAECRVPF